MLCNATYDDPLRKYDDTSMSRLTLQPPSLLDFKYTPDVTGESQVIRHSTKLDSSLNVLASQGFPGLRMQSSRHGYHLEVTTFNKMRTSVERLMRIQ